MRLDDLNEEIRKCDRCAINANRFGFQKTLGEGATSDVKILFICQKPHILRNIPLDEGKELWQKYGQAGFFTYNLRFYRLLNEAGLLRRQKETQQKLGELVNISIKGSVQVSQCTVRIAVGFPSTARRGAKGLRKNEGWLKVSVSKVGGASTILLGISQGYWNLPCWLSIVSLFPWSLLLHLPMILPSSPNLCDVPSMSSAASGRHMISKPIPML